MIGYQGRVWDAPMTDGLPMVDMAGMTCTGCRESIAAGDDAIVLGSPFHLECLLRSMMGDVAHLEGRCLCAGGRDHDDEGAYRESSQRALDWLLAHGRGRWA